MRLLMIPVFALLCLPAQISWAQRRQRVPTPPKIEILTVLVEVKVQAKLGLKDAQQRAIKNLQNDYNSDWQKLYEARNTIPRSEFRAKELQLQRTFADKANGILTDEQLEVVRTARIERRIEQFSPLNEFRDAALQAELKLAESQKKAIERLQGVWASEMQRLRDLELDPALGKTWWESAFNRAAMAAHTRFEPRAQRLWEEILTPDQSARFSQIELQRDSRFEGPKVLLRTDVLNELELTLTQQTKIRAFEDSILGWSKALPLLSDAQRNRWKALLGTPYQTSDRMFSWITGDDAEPAIKSKPEIEASVISRRVDVLFQAINEGQVQSAYETLMAPKFREVATIEQFKSICDRMKSRLGSLRRKEPSRLDIDPFQGTFVAKATYSATFELGTGTVFVVLQKIDDNWLLLRLNVNSPQLLDDPGTFREPTEVYVEDSEPCLPGTMIDVLDSAVDPPKVILANVRVLNVRWKVDNPFELPKAPGKGFVTFGLKPSQREAIGSLKSFAIRPHKR